METVRVLPLHGDAPSSRDQLLGGLERLLALNPTLGLYEALRARLRADPSWSPLAGAGAVPGGLRQ
jgi:hypothetical protein